MGLIGRGGGIDLGAGNDTIFAGIRRNPDGIQFIDGGSGTADKVSYAEAPSGVTASLDGQSNDGIFNGDKQNILEGVEQLEGSKSGDRLDGSNAGHRERITGGTGLDILNGLGGPDVFHEGPVASGSDIIDGGDGPDLVDYSERSVGVLIDHDFAFDDGQLGEEDLVDPSVEDIFGSKVADVITTRFNTGPNVVRGFGGDDTIRTGGGNDTLDGGTGADTLLGEDGDDTLDANDNTADVLRCGSGTADTANADLRDDDATGCETINLVGQLALAAKGAKLRVSWTHPVSWKQLRHVTVRIKDGRKVAGKVVIKPRAEKVAASGQVEIARSKLTHKGGKVTARLKLRYDAALAGKRLKADVIAADIHGTKQVERNAATLKVAR